MAAASYFALLDKDDGGAILLTGFRRLISFDPDPSTIDTSGSLESAFADMETAASQGEWLVVAADYGLGTCFDSAVAGIKDERRSLRAWAFAQATTLDADDVQEFLDGQLACVPEHLRMAGVAEMHVSLAVEDYVRRVERIRDWITAGDCYQVNLTFPIDFRLFGDPLALYARLRQRQPVRYGAFVAAADQTLLSFSPELFFERTGSRVTTRPMKGTAPRGDTSQADESLRCALLASDKERAENVMIVDLLRNDLGRLAQPGKVRVADLCQIEAYPTLWQMVSTISADLPGVGLYELFRALFPCGSITGAPKIAAMHKIAQLEDSPRGPYTGALGWIAPDGDCRFNVAIRTLEANADGHVRLGVGSGIVIDADPEREYAECLLKARFLTGFDPGFELIETMRLEQGVCSFQAAHLERLTTSARALGFDCPLSAIRTGLAEHASLNGQGVHRVRLTLAHDGNWKITSAILGEDTVLPWQAVIATERLDADDYLLRHKTTARYRYDRALDTLRDRSQIFDAIFFNTRDEVCEGARSSVFVECNGKLLTPPLACGLLPGVMRRHLLESGRAVEHVLHQQDLLNGANVYLANALRGLIPVNVVS